MCLCLCFLGGGLCFLDAGLCFRSEGGESERSCLDRADGGEGDRYFCRELGGVDEERERRFRELDGELRLERDGEVFL